MCKGASYLETCALTILHFQEGAMSIMSTPPSGYNTFKAMKSSPLLRPFCVSEFWGFSLLKLETIVDYSEEYCESVQSRLLSQV